MVICDVLMGFYNCCWFGDCMCELFGVYDVVIGFVCVVILFIDLVGFKKVNDMVGYDVGDVLLCSVVVWFLVCVGCYVFMWVGGDEFVIFVDDCDDFECFVVFVCEVIDVIVKLFVIVNNEYWFGVLIGISVVLCDGDDVVMLMCNVDLVMYDVK